MTSTISGLPLFEGLRKQLRLLRVLRLEIRRLLLLLRSALVNRRVHPAHDRHEAVELVHIENAVASGECVYCGEGDRAFRESDLAIGVEFVEGIPEIGEAGPEFGPVKILRRDWLMISLQRLDVTLRLPPLY